MHHLNTNGFFSGNNFHSLQDTVITEVCSLQNWVNANELTINFDPDKSCYTVFKPTNKKLPGSYKDGLILQNNLLQYREHTTYLGIILDDKLSWKEQITEPFILRTLFSNINLNNFNKGHCVTVLKSHILQ